MDASTREAKLIKTMMEHYAKSSLKDLAKWKNPVFSGYVFFSWMYFVKQNSMRYVPAWLVGFVFLFTMEQYVKYHVNSVAAEMFGYKSIWGLIRLLLTGQGETTRDASTRRVRRAILERVFGKPAGVADWKEEDNAEFPFSLGAMTPKVSSSEAAANSMWESLQGETREDTAQDDPYNWIEEDPYNNFESGKTQLSA